ncbi:MAG: hypothetical protein WC600_04455 [Desulfobaccales bacterium]
MLKWDPRTNCITEWQVPKWPQPLRFSGWGFEFGNWFGFFGHERLGGLACQIINCELSTFGSTKLVSTWDIKFPKATMQAQLTDELVAPTKLVRTLAITNLSEKHVGWLGDAVLRMVIPWEEGLVAEVEHREITHNNSNFYHDTEELEVALRWPDGRRLTVSRNGYPNVPPGLTPYLYVRDQPAMPQYPHDHCATPAWVVHARCLVDYPGALVFRLWRNPLILWSRGIIGRYVLSPGRLTNLWRAGEWRPGQRWSLFGVWPLRPKESFNITVEVEASL